MAPAKRPWFRLYTEAMWDRKLRRLVPAYRWLWVALLGMARQSPVPGVLLVSDGEPAGEADIVDASALSLREVRGGLVAFEKAGMIDHEPDSGAWRIVKWHERQFDSDISTERVEKHRARNDDETGDRPLHQRSRNGDVTHQSQRTDTEEQTRDDYTAPFLAAWSIYPRKIAKRDAFKAWKARTREGVSVETLALAVKHYAERVKAAGTEERFMLHGSTFFGPGRRYEDYLQPPQGATDFTDPNTWGRRAR